LLPITIVNVSLLRCVQALHKEALVWLSFGKKRQQMELASNKQVASNRRYCSRPLPAEPQKKLVFDWEVELKDGAEHYTSSYLLHKGYYLYGVPLDYQIYAAVFRILKTLVCTATASCRGRGTR
jgi:hypothetical protein